MIIDETFAGFMAEWDTRINVVRIAGPGLPSAEICRELHQRFCEERTRRLAARGETSELRAPSFGREAVCGNPVAVGMSLRSCHEHLTHCLGRVIGESHMPPTKPCQT